MQFKQLQINPKTFRDFNGIQTHGLCVSAAVLYHLSYEDPYMPVHWKQANMLSSSQHVKGMKHRMKMRFKVCCFWTSEFACLHSQGFFTFLPKHGKFRFPRWNCSYRASKFRRTMNMGGEKRIGTFPLTLNFTAPSRYYCLYLTSKDWIVTIWLTSKKNPKSWNIFDNAGPESAVIVITTNLCFLGSLISLCFLKWKIRCRQRGLTVLTLGFSLY